MAKPLGYSGAGPVREDYKHRRCQRSCLPISPHTETTLSPRARQGRWVAKSSNSFFLDRIQHLTLPTNPSAARVKALPPSWAAVGRCDRAPTRGRRPGASECPAGIAIAGPAAHTLPPAANGGRKMSPMGPAPGERGSGPLCPWIPLVPVPGVDPRSLPGVVIDVKDSPVEVPRFLPAGGQRQLRALPAPLSARRRPAALSRRRLLLPPPPPAAQPRHGRSAAGPPPPCSGRKPLPARRRGSSSPARAAAARRRLLLLFLLQH